MIHPRTKPSLHPLIEVYNSLINPPDMPIGIFFMSQIKKLIQTTVAALMACTLFISGMAQAAVSANYTKTDAPAATIGRSASNVLVLDITISDAWNSGLFTADIVQKAGSAFIAQGDALTAFTNPGTVGGVGFVNDASAGFQGTEPVIIDLDGDNVYTAQADVLIDGDGSTTSGVGTVDGSLTAGATLVRFNNGSQPTGAALCTDNLVTPTAIRIDTDTNCNNGAKTEGVYVLGTNATQANVKANNTWVFADLGGTAGRYDDGEDIFMDGLTPARQTYSPTPDTDTYSTGTAIHGDTLANFPADCDGAGIGSRRCRFTGGTFSSASSIVIDEGSKAGAAPNNTVDKQADQLIGMGVQNTGTAVNTTDIASVKVWMESGVTAGFQAGEDTQLGSMTVNSGDNKEWRLGGLSAPIPANGQRFYITADTAAAATHNATLQFQLAQFNDAGADGLATADNDRGAFVASDNDGPTDTAIVNANAQTIDGQGPTLTEVTPVPTPSNNRTPNYTFNTTEAGTISYPGTCSSATTAATIGDNVIQFTSLSDGTYNLCQIRVTDAYGNFTTLTATTFFVDGTAPTLTEVTPVTTPTTDTTPSYTFNTDEAGTITYGGGCQDSLTTTATTVPNNTVTFDALVDGTYSACTIQVTDALGNISPALTVNTFTIDTTAPVLAETLGITTPTNDNTPSYTFSSTEAGSIAYGGGCTSATTSAIAGSNLVVFNSLVDASYNCTVQVTDALGNASLVLNVSPFTIDTTGVILTEFAPIASPISDSTPDYVFVSDSAGTITFGGSCTATSYTNAIVGNNAIIFDTLADGTYTDCTVMVTDAALNPSNTLTVSPFTVDTTAPVLTEVTPVVTPTNDTTPNYTFNSSEAGNVSYGGSCSSATPSVSSGNSTITLNALVEGTYTDCTVTVTDTAGNASVALDITDFTIDLTAPTIVEVTPIATLTNDNTPDYIFSSDEAGAVTYGGSCTSSSLPNASVGNNTATFDTLADGTYTNCTVQVTDTATNAGNTLAVPTFEVDTTAPVLAEVTPVPSVTYNHTPDYTFSTTEAGTIAYTGACVSSTTTAVVGNNTVTFNDLPVGTYGSCGITVTDAATNTSTTLSITTFIISSRRVATPALDVTGTANPTVVQVGGTITFTFTAINRGDVAMNNVSVSSDFCATPTLLSGDMDSDANLDPTESWIYTCSIIATNTQQGSVTVRATYNGADQTDSVNISVAVLQDGGNDLICTVESAATEGCSTDGNGGNGGETTEETQTDAEREQALAHLTELALAPHDLVKARDTKAVYYIAPDGRKHLFTSANIYFTWYCTFTGIKAVTSQDLATIADGSAVTYRPGVRMVKLTTDNKVYAIENGRTLRWISSEEIATELYGATWNSNVIDVANFNGYSMGADITSADQYNPLAQEQSVTVPADVMNITGYTVSPVGPGLACRHS